MTDKELLYQLLQREVVNIIESTVPQFKMFSGIISNYIIELIDPYVNAFLSPDDGRMNQKAAGAFIKKEANEKIEKFLKEFEDAQKDL